MRRCRLFSIFFLLVVAATCRPAFAIDSAPTELFYFNPDSPQSNLSHLKRDMDSLLTKANFSIIFQPFAHFVDFDAQLKKRPPAFLFVPDWYLKSYGANLNLRPLLVPLRNGKTYYRKVLLATGSTQAALSGKPTLTVAMTSMGPEGDMMLKSLFMRHGMASSQISTIIVPKDIDALFALTLGQVDLALVVKENVDLIAKINPNMMQPVHPLMESEPIPMPVLCFTAGIASSSDIQEVKEIFLTKKSKERLTNIMEMLQINEWQAVTQ